CFPGRMLGRWFGLVARVASPATRLDLESADHAVAVQVPVVQPMLLEEVSLLGLELADAEQLAIEVLHSLEARQRQGAFFGVGCVEALRRTGRAESKPRTAGRPRSASRRERARGRAPWHGEGAC